MTDSFEFKKERLKKIQPSRQNGALIRELAAEIYPRCKSEGDASGVSLCLLKLRAAENMKRLFETQCEFGTADISQLINSVCLCADILLSDLGVSIQTELEPAEAACCPAVITDAFLNLLSNAARFGRDKTVFVSVRPQRDFVYVGLESGGKLDFDTCTPKIGVKSAANCARLHKGSLFYSAGGSSVTAAFSVSNRLRPTRKYELPVFSELLSDEFSPVHIGLADALEPHFI